MNYLRGAYQYYRDLPPINAATLTGAIDVIVIERPAEPSDIGAKPGETVLACTPFHVRFGKLQILRPAENQVTVIVNGKVTPFPMKIGEAGEAFFVCETEGEVPREMQTSPILGPCEPGAQHTVDKEPKTDRFGSKPYGIGMQEVQQLDRSEYAEPPFLDLNIATAPELQSPSFPSTSRPSTPGSRASTPPTSLSASSEKDKDSVRSPSQPPPASKANYEPSETIHNLPQLPEAIQSHNVEYRQDVVLDMEGYHVHPDAAPNLRPEGDHEDREDDTQPRSWTDTLLGCSSPKPDDEEATIENSKRKVVPPIRALSEPPPDMERDEQDLEADTSLTTLRAVSEEPEPLTPSGIQHLRSQGASSSTPVLPHLSLSLSELPAANTMPDYTWEWGSLPTPQTARPRIEVEEEEKTMLGVGGKIYPKSKTGEEFGLELDDKRTSFELSLCGPEAVRGSEFENATAFQARLVTYKDFVESESIVDDPNLVMRWDEKYITCEDFSPLFPALARWRLEAAPVDLASGSPERQPSPPASLSRASTSGWSRWWTRRAAGDSISSQADILEPPKSDTTMRRGNSTPPSTVVESPPALPESASGPLDRTEPEKPQVKTYAKALRLTSDQLKQLQLKPGPNTVSFSLSSSAAVVCTARIFLWQNTDQLVVSDIDGTITKSDALGHVFTMIGRDWTHSGVAKLYTDICRNGYKIMYLTSRAIGQADSTREYLKGINQNNYQLPEGPVIMSPDRLIAALHREVIMRKPEVFKMACLRDIQKLFGHTNKHAFYAGFGNRITDALSYRSVNIPSGRIFTIDSSGVVKMELLELAGYKSSYIHMTDLVDQMFPPVHRKWAQEFTDLNYWRTPMPNIDIPDLRPPSPALSARSDTSSRLNRIRNFTLGLPGTRSTIMGSKSGDSTPNGNADAKEAKPARPTSPLVSAYTAESLSEDEDFALSRSPTDTHSMPGSMPGSPEPQDGSWMPRRDELEDDDQAEGEGEEYDEWPAAAKSPLGDDDFEDDLLATGVMENVPFL
ncbi:LNS2-domain-containing protein [Dacryopinax primogenitus]|uniref:phosphatidate phosphatase n=1 Tax=Dacryopinax primogenitus (strain DJM 731) TaxID=1858805 RepID=M5GCR6_DACPD|nr:LNS2-domain-containing protein [Dacryopinax primogenitus]EJU06380.1 LNS2-domain-containing protein [Dacryopinax primogenitus]